MPRTSGNRANAPWHLAFVGFLIAVLVDRNHEFVVLPEVEAFVVPRSALSHQNHRVTQHQQQHRQLQSTSASAAYLESISYKPPSVEDGLLGATSKYLDAISSVSNQLSYYDSGGSMETTDPYYFMDTAAQTQAQMPFSEDLLVNEVVQRVTQEFSSALEAFAGDTYDSFLDTATTTMLSQSRPQYLWEMDDDEPIRKPAAKVAQTVQEAATDVANTNNVNPEETMRELTTKLDNSFRSFRESLSSSTHSVTSTFSDSLRRETTQPNAALTTAKQQQNIVNIRQKIDEGQLNPEVLEKNAKEAVNMASGVAEAANKAIVESIPSEIPVQSITSKLVETPATIGGSLSQTASRSVQSLSETQQGIQKSLGSMVTNTNTGIERALSSIAESTAAATHSLAESTTAATSAVSSAIGGASSSISGSVTAATSAAANAIGGAASGAASAFGGATAGATNAASGTANSLAATASSAAMTAKDSMGAAGASVKAAVVTAKPGTAATSGKISAVALSANQGFGMPGNAYDGGGDLAGLLEMVTATIVSIPRAVVDATMMETNPNAMDDMMEDLMEGISTGLYQDILVPLAEPLRESAAIASSTPLDQSKAVLETLQLVLALVVSIPRAAVEGLTGQPISEVQAQVAQTDIDALANQLSGFASTVASLLISFLKVVAQSISFVVSAATSQGGGVAAASAGEQQEVAQKLISFMLEDILPAIIDGLVMVLQQFVLLLLEGGSYIVAAL